MKKYLKPVAWTAFMAMSITIFLFSHQPAEQSSQVSQSVLHEVLTRIVSGYAGMEREKQMTLIACYHNWIRNAAHFFLYTLWGFSLSFLLQTYCLRRKRLVIATIGGGVLYAVLDELHQLFIEGRSAQFVDVCVDVSGVLTGLGCFLAIVYCLTRICRKLLSKKNN